MASCRVTRHYLDWWLEFAATARTGIPGMGVTKTSKLLARKRLAFLPVIDARVDQSRRDHSVQLAAPAASTAALLPTRVWRVPYGRRGAANV